MKYEDKEKLLEIFNTPAPDTGGKGVDWTQGYGLRFTQMYRALAASMTETIQKAIANSELRKSIKVSDWVPHKRDGEIVVPNPMGLKPGTPYLKGLCYWDEYLTVGEEGYAGSVTFRAATQVRLGKVTPEAVEHMMRQIVKAIVSFEIEAVNVLKDAADTDDITMFVRQPYVAYDDPTLIKRKQIGVFGWEEVAIVAV
jgi:hypothetical protein